MVVEHSPVLMGNVSFVNELKELTANNYVRLAWIPGHGEKERMKELTVFWGIRPTIFFIFISLETC
jgi:hypothetical protein